jgi:hypothetical protein
LRVFKPVLAREIWQDPFDFRRDIPYAKFIVCRPEKRPNIDGGGQLFYERAVPCFRLLALMLYLGVAPSI